MCRNIRHSRLLFGRIPARLGPLHDQSQTRSHDGSSSEGTACTSGRDSDPVAKRVRSTLLACL